MTEFIDVDPSELHVAPRVGRKGLIPASWPTRSPNTGTRWDGMPPLQPVRGKDGHLRINDSVTRAAKLRPGELIPAQVIQHLPRQDVTRMPTVKEVLL